MALDAGHALDAGQAEERRVRRANAIRAVAQGVADTPFADGHGSQAAAWRPRKLLVDPRHGPRLTTLRLPRNAGLRYEASSICARSWQVSSRGLLGAAMPTAIGTLIPTTGGMTLANVVGTKGQVLIANHIRDQLGIGPGWIAIQRAVDDRVEIVFLPPEHRESLKGSLAPHMKASVPPDEWQRVRKRGWHEAATRGREAPSSG